MIKSFGAKNFMSFKDWLVIDCSLPAKARTETKNPDPYSYAMCFKGANASGKSNALKILLFLKEFITNSFNNKPNSKIEVSSFFDNEEDIELFVEFQLEDLLYTYELTVKPSEIISEKLYKKQKRKTLIFSRSKDRITKYSFSSQLSSVKLRSNASFISTYFQHEVVEIKPIYYLFHNFYSNLDENGQINVGINHTGLSKFYYKNSEYLDFTRQYLKKFDTGIIDVHMKVLKENETDEHHFPIFHHKNGNKTSILLHREQSGGTISLYRNLIYYKAALRFGGILIMDEFDINLHPDILPHLIRLFLDKETNPNHSQIIFSTHNPEIIDLVGKYRTYLFNKTDGESIGYRLDELNPELIRNDRPIEPLYKAHKIGGVPIIK